MAAPRRHTRPAPRLIRPGRLPPSVVRPNRGAPGRPPARLGDSSNGGSGAATERGACPPAWRRAPRCAIPPMADGLPCRLSLAPIASSSSGPRQLVALACGTELSTRRKTHGPKPAVASPPPSATQAETIVSGALAERAPPAAIFYSPHGMLGQDGTEETCFSCRRDPAGPPRETNHIAHLSPPDPLATVYIQNSPASALKVLLVLVSYPLR